MKIIKVNAPSRNYPVYIGEKIFKHLIPYFRQNSSAIFVIFDKKVAGTVRQMKKALGKSGRRAKFVSVSGGENFKQAQQILALCEKLVKMGARRDCLVVAVGGGSIGDGAGFLASVLMRGILWIGVPTTLLAQVDSSVGGKTAVNNNQGKNLVGTFHQPAAVFCDLTSLQTLGPREIISGLGEILKYGFVFDPALYAYIQQNWKKIESLDSKVMTSIISKSVKWKAKCVAIDERDVTGQRETLNFGHTFGHALESVTEYKKFQHGESIIWGMRFALALSVLKTAFPREKFYRINEFLKGITVPGVKREQLPLIFKAMKKDKKVRSGKINFVLLRDLKKPLSFSAVNESDLWKAAKMIGIK